MQRPAKHGMSRNTIILSSALLLLGGLYAWQFTDWFVEGRIQIRINSRPGILANDPNLALPIIFGLDRDYALDQVLVVSLASQTTNRQPLAVWELKRRPGSSHPTKIRGFAYSAELEGLESTRGTPPIPLQPGIPYRIEVVSGRLRGTADFVPKSSAE